MSRKKNTLEKRQLHKWKHRLCIYIFTTLYCFLSLGQQKSLKFTHYSKQDGLNQSSVNYIYQDTDDYLWIANFGGVNRFDGYTFTSYTNEFGDQNSISDNSVWTILERKDNTLWFGTKSGLSRYHKTTDDFTNYYIRNEKTNLGNLAIKSLFEDKKKRFYIGSEGQGLFLFSDKKHTFAPITAIPNTAKVSAIIEDSSGNIWVGTENLGLYVLNPDLSQSTSMLQAQSLKSITIWSLYADAKGNIWIGTDQDGLIRYNTASKSFLFYQKEEKRFSYQAGGKIKFITKFQDQIWIASATEGLSYYSEKEERFYNYNKNHYAQNSLFDNDVSSLFPGTSDVLYVGFYMKGFDKVIATPFSTLKNDPKKENTLSNDNVYCIYKDRDELLWFGTYGGGLNRYDPKSKKFKHYIHQKNNPKSISHDWVRIIYEDREGDMWIGTWGGGLNKFNRTQETFTRYLPDKSNNNSLNHNIITAIFEDLDGDLWIGTYGGGINIYQPKTDNFRSITHHSDNPNSLSDDHITSFYQKDPDILWICTYGGGLNLYNKKTGDFERFLPNPDEKFSLNNHKTLHIFGEPEKDFLWITTLGGGINKFYPKENKFIHFTENNGLSNNSTMGMIKDHKDNYWISSNNGLSYFDQTIELFTNYTTADGLGSDDYNLEAYAKMKSGTLFFGGKNGVTYFNPKEIKEKEPFPKVAITKMSIEDSTFTHLPENLKVPYKNRISFTYAAINPNKTKNIEYAYQLIGQDQEWRKMKKNRYLELANLNPGKYELRIKSTNNHKEWNPDYTSISFYIPTPWYLSWYFRVAIILTTLLLGYTYYWLKMRRVKIQNKILEEKVIERTRTIEEKTVALRIEKEKTENAYERSSGKRMLSLVENMLEVQKFENTEVQLDLKRNNLKSMANEAIRQIKILATEKRIQIKNKIDPKYIVYSDNQIIERVFVNLLSNAIKFSNRDSCIEIFTEIDSHQKDEVVIIIQDHGVGIPENKVSSIFNKFSQIEARNSGGSRSTGLGLAFCKMAIEAHNGKIWVTSVLNKGSKFYFTLARKEDSIILKKEESKEENYENPIYSFELYPEDLAILLPFKEKINKLSIYETGSWLTVFEGIKNKETENIKNWKQKMMLALTNFDDKAFMYLRQIATREISPSNELKN